MGKDLKAENLTISLPNVGCNKNCPYCVSRMTGYMESDYWLMSRNIKKVRKTAEAAEVTSVLFTSKGETLLSFDELKEFANKFRDFPLELQTNGLLLDESILNALCVIGMNVIAISIDSIEQLHMCMPIVRGITSRGMIPRATLNLVGIDCPSGLLCYTPTQLIENCADLGFRQVTFRRIVCPENPKHQATVEWIEKNIPSVICDRFIGELDLAISYGKVVRILNSGMGIWDIGGVSVMYSKYCVQERDCGNDLRSLIFQEDGHLYTSWNSNASVLF